jgi:hypothetical protein
MLPSPLPQFFLYLNQNLMSVPQRWVEMLSAFFPWHAPGALINLLSLPITCTHVYNQHLGVTYGSNILETPVLGSWPRIVVTVGEAWLLVRLSTNVPRGSQCFCMEALKFLLAV